MVSKEDQYDRRFQGTQDQDREPRPKGPRVVHEVPGAGGPVGPRGRGRLPPACRGQGDLMIERRRVIARAGGLMAAAAATALVEAPNVIAQPKVQWRLSTAYPPVLD